MDDISPVSSAELPTRIASLISAQLEGVRDVVVSSLQPMFGGNARRAWSFDVKCVLKGDGRLMRCVMLSQVSGRQVESEIRSEFEVLEKLKGQGTRAPVALALDETGEAIGSPSIVMERLDGEASAVKLLRSTDRSGTSRLLEDLAHVVANLHRVQVRSDSLDATLTELSPRDTAAHQIAHWRLAFEKSRLEPLPVMESLFSWLRKHLPEPTRLSLVHGDLRPGNFLYAGQRVTGLLDWEMAHVGDPAEDLAWIYRPLWSLEQFVGLREFATMYERRSDTAIPWSSILYYRIFSELKFATISLTAARAFVEADVPNLRHADRAATVAPCLRRCLDWIDSYERESRE